MDINVKIGNRVKSCRENASMSQKDLAQVSKLDLSYIVRIENGNDIVPVVDMKKIVDALNLSLSDFFNDPIFDE